MKVAPTDDIARCHAIRHIVFVDEQGVSEADEYDGRDAEAWHFLIFDSDRAIGTARAFVEGQTVKIGRVAILKDGRGSGYGKGLVRGILDWAITRGMTRAKLDAQLNVLPFYEDLGFVASGPVFDDAGIPHRHMDRDL